MMTRIKLNYYNIKVLISIVTFNNSNSILHTLESLKNDTKLKDYVISMVDNKSDDDTCQKIKNFIKKEKKLNILFYCSDQNLGWSRGNNLAVSRFTGFPEYIFFLNPDAKIDMKNLKQLIDFLDKDNSCSVVTPSFNTEGRIYPGIIPDYTYYDIFLSILGIRRFKSKMLKRKIRKLNKYYIIFKNVYPSGAAFLVKSSDFYELGKFDERYFLYFDDVDFGRKLKLKNLKIAYLPNTIVHHYVGVSINSTDKNRIKSEQNKLIYYTESAFKFYKKWENSFVYNLIYAFIIFVDYPLKALFSYIFLLQSLKKYRGSSAILRKIKISMENVNEK